ncbi:MAG: mandelate racemase/muconate lactonizing enzyme family protein, partial [Chloroflexia bacterium]|nr:mandelate racemase/muconate lactonizing enzyme family protein [Chloroflexia bacterium]
MGKTGKMGKTMGMTVETGERPEDRVRTASRPSELKITDLRTATVGWDNWYFTLVRIDTNQGLSGYGEV